MYFGCQESLHLDLNPRYLGITNILNLTNNKQRGQLCILVVRKDKRKKKHKQSINDDNLTIIGLHTPHHVEEETTAHLVRRWMTRFNHWKALYAPF